MRSQTQNNWKKLADLLEKGGEKEYDLEEVDLSIEDKEIYRVLEHIRLDCDYDHASKMKSDVQESIYHKIFNANEEVKPQKGINILPLLLSVAASIAIVLSIVSLHYTYKDKQDIASWIVFSSPNGVSQVVLPDSSVVTVNKGSTVSYTTGYNHSERLVRLNGEACFNVMPNKEVPFIVSTRNVDVKVLGTVFNVSAYEDDEEIVTSLLSGSVELKNKRNERVYHLIPNQSAIYSNLTEGIEIQPFDAEYVVGWMDGKLLFKKKTFNEICKVLEKKFNCTIQVSNTEVQKKLFTGKFVNDESLPQILNIIRVIVPFNYTITNNHVKIN